MPDFSAVRIVIAEPRLARPESEVVEALSGLGIGVVIEVVRDASECRACIASRGADLVILDWRLGREAVHVLADLRRGGLPVVVVLPEDVEDAETLSAFRQGAADCVELGGGFADLLPAVALDLLRRSRQNRERDAAERRIVELQRYTENILQNMNSALLVVDRQGEVTAANPTAEAILGVGSGGIGRSFGFGLVSGWEGGAFADRANLGRWSPIQGSRDGDLSPRRPRGPHRDFLRPDDQWGWARDACRCHLSGSHGNQATRAADPAIGKDGIDWRIGGRGCS